MNTIQDYDFIAERQWDYHVSPSEKVPVRVGFTKPKQGTRGKFWEAKFLIFWPDGKIIERAVYGTDSVDALIQLVALFRIECDKLTTALGETVTFESTGALFGYENGKP